MLSENACHDGRTADEAIDSQQDQRQPGSVIRPVTEDDFQQIMDIENSCFPGNLAYSEEQMRYLLFKANATTFVEVSGDTLCGYVTATFRKNSGIAGIETIGVAPHSQGRGVGKRLLSAAERHMAGKGVRKARLEVSSGNEAALSMYSKSGYRVSREILDYYIYEHHGTRNALRMEKDLPCQID